MKQLLLVILIAAFVSPVFASRIQGDADCSGDINIGDVVALIEYIFGGRELPFCPDGEVYPKTIVMLDTVIADTSLRIVEIITEDTSLINQYNYGSVGSAILLHTYKVYKMGVLCDSIEYMDITRRMWINPSSIDTFPQGCADLPGIVLRADSTSIVLGWTIPGVNGDSTYAKEYDMRYATFLLTPQTWGIAIQAQGEPNPVGTIAGMYQSFRVTGLVPGTLYYFGLKYLVGSTWSSMSNIAVKSTAKK